MTRNLDAIADLLRAAGARPPAPPDRARRVEAAVRLEWQDVVQKRAGRRRAVLIAASCLTSAAVIALMLHSHAGQAVPEAAIVRPALERATAVAGYHQSRIHGALFRGSNEDRPPDRGVPRHVLAAYSLEPR